MRVRVRRGGTSLKNRGAGEERGGVENEEGDGMKMREEVKRREKRREKGDEAEEGT